MVKQQVRRSRGNLCGVVDHCTQSAVESVQAAKDSTGRDGTRRIFGYQIKALTARCEKMRSVYDRGVRGRRPILTPFS